HHPDPAGNGSAQMNFSTESLTIVGHDGNRIRNLFFRQETGARDLAIVFPGRSYTFGMHLLYYPITELLGRGCDLLQFDYKYDASFFELPEEEMQEKFETDVRAAFDAARAQGTYDRLFLIGKSLGTRALGYLLTQQRTEMARFRDVRSLWLTPLTGDEILYPRMKEWKGPAFYVVGTRDEYCYVPDKLGELEKECGWKGMTIDNADHSMNIENDLPGSLEALRRIALATTEFLVGR
ncbi:MAG: hypothetical protein ACXVBW_15755, partial [Bdellovibrionota bacterium]